MTSNSSELWSYSAIANKTSNILSSNNGYKDEAKEKFKYFRIGSPKVWFIIDINDLPDEIKDKLEYWINDCKNQREKYHTLNKIFVEVIISIYKQNAHIILEDKIWDKEGAENAINELALSFSDQWKLIGFDKLPSTFRWSRLAELNDFAPPKSLSSKEPEVENPEYYGKDKYSKKNAKYKYKQNEDNLDIANNDKQDQPNEIERLLSKVNQRYIEIFKDSINKLYVTLRINDHVECVDLHGSRLKSIIRKEYFDIEKKLLTEDRLDGVMELIECNSLFNESIKKIDLKLRVAKTDSDTFYYDLTNPKWEIVKITSEGWTIIKNNDVPLFKRYENNCNPQVYPSNENKEQAWIKFLGLFNLRSKNDKLLLSVYIISLFIPDIPKVILVVSGSGGGAKTTTFKMIKNIIDPGSIDTSSFPKQINDLIQMLSHHYVNYFDNVSYIPDEVSDALCRAVTGSGSIKRALYKNDLDFIYKFKVAVGINGINLATTRSDFLDRSLIINQKRIDKKARKREEEIDKEFEELKPGALGYIMDILVKVLRYKKDHENKKILHEHSRMADFAECGEIISRCLGNKENEFIEAYQENIDKQNDEVIEASPVAEALLLFIRNLEKDYWEGTPTELYKKLEDIISQIKPEVKRSNLWPKASNRLTSKINEIEPNLKEKNIEVITGEKNTRGERVIRIRLLKKINNDNDIKQIEDTDQDKLYNPFIHRRGNSDLFECEKCPQKGDIHFMKQHICSKTLC